MTMPDSSIDVDDRETLEHRETIADETGSNFNTRLRNVDYEDHFLTFRRAGNHAPYLQKVIEYTDGGSLEFACGTGTQVLAIDPYVEDTCGVELSRNRTELTFERGKRMSAVTATAGTTPTIRVTIRAMLRP